MSISLGGSGAAAVTTAINELTTSVSAYIEDSKEVESAGGVTILAEDESVITSEIVSVALSVGLVSLGVGVTLAGNTIDIPSRLLSSVPMLPPGTISP